MAGFHCFEEIRVCGTAVFLRRRCCILLIRIGLLQYQEELCIGDESDPLVITVTSDWEVKQTSSLITGTCLRVFLCNRAYPCIRVWVKSKRRTISPSHRQPHLRRRVYRGHVHHNSHMSPKKISSTAPVHDRVKNFSTVFLRYWCHDLALSALFPTWIV